MPKTPVDSMPDLNPPEGFVVGIPGEHGFYAEETPAQRERMDQQNVRDAIGNLSAKHAAHLVSGFHGAESSYFGRPLDDPNTVNSIITRVNENGTPVNEVIGQGPNAEESLYDAWLGMRKLESAHTKPLLRMHMDADTAVDFTGIDHYAPKIAPGIESYKLPGFVAKTVEGNDRGRHTYDKTIATEGWDKQLFSQVERFTTSERGAELVKSLKIHSLRALTPEQAVKLTLSMVQDLFKYSRDAAGEPAGEAADQMTAMQLIEEGFNRKGDPNWEGNGVCRNIASTVKAVFEAVKANQGKLHMLHSTYVGYTGSDEDFRIKKRENAGGGTLNFKEQEPGHAWNTFTTVDNTGNASITIADVTWALENTPEDALRNMDYTLTRSARTARELFNQSKDKATSFPELNDYYKDFLRNGLLTHRSTTTEFDDMTQFIMNEYLEAAAVALRDAATRHEEPMFPLVPGYILGAAYRLGDNLGKNDIQTLYRLEQAYAHDTFDAIARSYAKGGKNTILGAQHRAASLTFEDDGLQQKLFSQLSADQLREYADADSGFRIRVREFMPDVLPAFDPTNLSDQRELVKLAKQNGLPTLDTRPQAITRALQRQFLQAAGGRQELVEKTVEDRDLYAQVRDYPQIIEELSRT